MPRTKVNNKKTVKKCDEQGIDRVVLLAHLKALKREVVDGFKTRVLAAMEKNHTKILRQFQADILKTKLYDLKKMGYLPINSTASINVTTTCKQDILNQTKSVRKGRKQVTRSSSLTDEESSNSVGRASTRQSRATVQKTKQKTARAARSLSRSNTNSSTSKFVTPLNKRTPPNAYEVVTPKCKPNTPHVLLRRPKAGEVALSFQGSPLLTAAVVRDDVANINIPLNDGTLLSLQPQKGLRLSQIPQFDDVTLLQLETLNEHIQMVLQAAHGNGII